MIITAQAAVCTSMIASIIIEKRFIQKSQAAHFSVLRGINDGPRNLVHLILSSKSVRLILRLESYLAILLLLVGMGLQFSSTILLSDVDVSVVAGENALLQLPSLLSESQDRVTTSTNSYKALPPQYAVFGELSSGTTTTPDAHGFSDTGLIQRAFLPLQVSEKREEVRSYEGNSIVMSTRVACMRPNIENLRYSACWWDNWADKNWGQLNGTLDYDSSLEDNGKEQPCGSKGCPLIPFSCDIPGAYDGYGWQSNICLAGGVGGTFWSSDTGPEGTTINSPWAINSSVYLVLSTNMGSADWGTLRDRGIGYGPSVPTQAVAEEKEWRSYQLLPGKLVNISLCFQAFNLKHSFVHMASSGNIREPEMRYDSRTGTADTRDIRRYFGTDALKLDFDRRGILRGKEIREPANYTNISQPTVGLDADKEFTMKRVKGTAYSELAATESNSSILACSHCVGGGGSTVHADLSAILEDTILSTGRASEAIKVYITSISMTIYYLYQKKFTVSEEVSLTSVNHVLTANDCKEQGACSGFVSVVTLLGVHLAIVSVITTLYLTQTRFSRHSNIWHAVSQLISQDLDDILEISHNMGDKDVIAAVRSEGNDHEVRLGGCLHGGRVKIKKHDG